jgi:thiamine-phosphate diphosphorylase
MIIYVTDINKFPNENIFLENINIASKSGIKYIQVRVNNKNSNDLTRIYNLILQSIGESETKIIINEEICLAKKTDAFGFHMKSNNKLSAKNIKIKTGVNWLSKSVHTIEDILTNNDDKFIDAFILGTIFKSNSHPNGKTLGIENFNQLVKISNKPVIGIGGIGSNNSNLVYESGASGIAVITSIATSKNIKKTLKDMESCNDKYFP